MSDFWDNLLAGSSPNHSVSVDQHLGGKSVSSSFEGVRGLTDKMRAANALKLPVEAGTKVVFAGGMGSYLSYEDAPVEGASGEVVEVRSATGDITHHDGKVFVQWEDGKLRSIHAEHLRKAATSNKKASKKTPWKVMPDRLRNLAARYWTEEREKATLWEDNDRLREVEESAQRDGVVWKGDRYVPDVFDRRRHEVMPSYRGASRALDREGKEKQTRQILESLDLLSHHKIKPKVETDPDGWTQIRFVAPVSMAQAYIESHLDEQLGSSAPFTVESGGNFVYITVGEDERNNRRASKIKTSSLGDLTQFLKRADGKLVHKSTNDLWSYSKDADGNFVVERLFDDEGAPLRD